MIAILALLTLLNTKDREAGGAGRDLCSINRYSIDFDNFVGEENGLLRGGQLKAAEIEHLDQVFHQQPRDPWPRWIKEKAEWLLRKSSLMILKKPSLLDLGR